MTKNMIPDIRFKGFTDDWEQRKLEDLVERHDNLRIPITASERTKGEIPYYGANGIQDFVDGFTHEGEFVLIAEDGANSLSDYPIRFVSGKVWVNNHAHVVSSIAGKSTNLFTMYSLKNVNIEPYLVGGGRAKLNSETMMKLPISITCLEEQTKIGEFFKIIDDTITLHQRKLESLEKMKKSMLQKMFPRSGQVIPELRFAGFTDDWEQCKLGEIAERVVRKNTNLESTLPLTISAIYGLVDQITYFNKRVASRDVRNYYLVKKGEFAYNKSYSNGFPFGAVKRLERYEQGVLSTLYIVFSPKNDIINSDYLVSYYDTNNWHIQIAERAAEGARDHGLLNISTRDFFETELKLPRDLEEQYKIGEFFKTLDHTITLHQQKLDKIKEIKKSFLQKMFI